MASLPIKYRTAALDELSEAIAWYGERDEKVANKLRDVVRAKLREVAQSPNHWPLKPDRTRQIFLGSFPYLLIVRETQGELELVAFAHASRKPGYWRNRLRE